MWSTRREFLAQTLTLTSVATSNPLVGALSNPTANRFDVNRYHTPYKLGRLVLEKSGQPSAFDSQAVDGIFVFSHENRFYMTYLGFDGVGYQTGIAVSGDLINWEKRGLIFARDPSKPWLRNNAALTSIVRNDDIWSTAPLKRIKGRYLGTWHAYPGTGYEEGRAVIGLAWSDDLMHWEAGEPILRAEDGAPWERGGLYRSFLMEDKDVFYLFYNAKNVPDWPWFEQWGVAISHDLVTWKRSPLNPLVRNGSVGAPDELFASDPYVVRDGSKWIAYYFGFDVHKHARNLLAIGDSPFRFEKVGCLALDIGAPGSIDSQHAHKPVIISWKGDLYQFYTAVDAPNQLNRGISVARSRPWA